MDASSKAGAVASSERGGARTAARLGVLAYGIACYLLHWVATALLIGFLGNLVLPKTIDSGKGSATGAAICVDVLLLTLFVGTHWTMAQSWFKQRWTRVVPEPMERSTYVLVTSIVVGLMVLLWQPMPDPVWVASSSSAQTTMLWVYLGAWSLAILATFPIGHFELFGLRQAWLYWKVSPHTEPTPRPSPLSALYDWLPHPIFIGYAVAIWAAPTMSWGRFLVASVLSLFLLVDVRLAANRR